MLGHRFNRCDSTLREVDTPKVLTQRQVTAAIGINRGKKIGGRTGAVNSRNILTLHLRTFGG
jgi:hypothetical protein